jgi:hypothetical protein
MTATIVRDGDSATLSSLSLRTVLEVPDALYGLKKKRSFGSGPVGQAIPIASAIEQKTFTLTFTSSDTSGTDQQLLQRFFSVSDEWYSITWPEAGIPLTEFAVISVDPVFSGTVNTIEVLCQSRYGDFIEKTVQSLYSGTLAANASFTAWSGSVTNTSQQIMTVRLTIEAASLVTWKAGTAVQLNSGTRLVKAAIAKLLPNGVTSTWTGRRFELNSYEEVTAGKGYISSPSAEFWRLLPGETAAVAVPSFVNPVTTAVPLTVKIEAITIRQSS